MEQMFLPFAAFCSTYRFMIGGILAVIVLRTILFSMKGVIKR